MPRALLVGADAVTRSVLLPVLGELGCQVDEVAEEPWPLGLTFADVVLVVIVVQGGSGPPDALVVLHALQQMGCFAPAVVLTPEPRLDLSLRAFALGVTDVMTWPVRPQGLRLRLEAQVWRGLKRLRQQGDAAGASGDTGL